MKCPMCHKNISDNITVCPHCHKVLALECPVCKSVGEASVCEKCGYIMLTKCAKCGKTVSTQAKKCKCGFPVKTSISINECETDEFASIVITFSSLKNIRKSLGSQEVFTKFFYKLRNLLISTISNFEGKVITYNDVFVINFNKELSFPTSANKAVRLAIKIMNTLSELNLSVIEELGMPLNINIAILKKNAEQLLEKLTVPDKIKPLAIKNNEEKYLKGMQIILDQFVQDCISKDYKTDTLFSVEDGGKSFMYYKIILRNYVLPPNEKTTDLAIELKPEEILKSNTENENDIYNFKVFDINAKCKFKKTNATSFFDKFEDNKIISIRSEQELGVSTSELVRFFQTNGYNVIKATCTEELNFKPWGVLEQLFKDYYNLSFYKSFIPSDFEAKKFNSIIDLINSKPRNASTSEDARFAYIEDFGSFLGTLKNCVIIIDGFEYMDDTSIQTFELYFDKFKNIKPRFVFITDKNVSLHSKFKGLLKTRLYTEYVLQKSGIDNILSGIKEEAGELIQSSFFTGIKESFNGSAIFFDNAIRYLQEKNILISDENRLIIKSSKSVVIPDNMRDLIKARLKHLSKNNDASMILAYSTYLSDRLDFEILTKLGIKNINKTIKTLVDRGFAYVEKNFLYINNYNLIKPIIQEFIRGEGNEFLVKNILANFGKNLDDCTTLLLLGKLGLFKEEYLLLWKNSQFAMQTGDYDAYLKNCFGFLSLVEHIKDNMSQEDIENNKKEVYQNILASLYNYSPEKIYDIENVLLQDAIKDNNNDKIVKLSNLMLQGALIASNYTDALTLLHNILERMENPTLIVEGAINTRFLLLSLINIEILYNIGDFRQCVETAKDILSILKPSILDKIKPANFSAGFFVEHILETFRLAGFAKLFLMDKDLENFFNAVKEALGVDLPAKNCIIAVRDFLNGKRFAPSNIEGSEAFSKVIYLLLQEFSEHKGDFKTFAQNIYQAKLLSSDIHQKQIEMFCDLLIAYSYANMGIKKKAEIIYNDILEKSEKTALFSISILAKYFIVKLYLADSRTEEALSIINNVLSTLEKRNNDSKVLYVLFEKLFIDVAKTAQIDTVDIEYEEQKLESIKSNGQLIRLLN